MSSTPSPSKRSVLSPKPSNISSPFKKSTPFKPFTHNKPATATVATPSKKPKLNFTIYEDQPATTKSNTSASSNDTVNHYEQENILQPKKLASPSNRSQVRKPLENLSINQFPGYIQYSSAGTRQLTELYQPINYDNDFNSLHKQTNIPSYLTPTRNSKDKYLFRSTNFSSEVDPILDGCVDETDDTELMLMKKHLKRVGAQSATAPNMIRKHRRSMSVGKNDSKLRLIKKNHFTILSN